MSFRCANGDAFQKVVTHCAGRNLQTSMPVAFTRFNIHAIHPTLVHFNGSTSMHSASICTCNQSCGLQLRITFAERRTIISFMIYTSLFLYYLHAGTLCVSVCVCAQVYETVCGCPQMCMQMQMSCMEVLCVCM